MHCFKLFKMFASESNFTGSDTRGTLAVDSESCGDESVLPRLEISFEKVTMRR